MRLYLAARYGRRQEMLEVAHALRRRGHEVTARWILGLHDSATDVRAALDDLEDVERAECVVSFTEGEAVSGRARGGRHVEFGYALARGKRVVIVGPRENVFHSLFVVEAVASVPELLTLLGAETTEAAS